MRRCIFKDLFVNNSCHFEEHGFIEHGCQADKHCQDSKNKGVCCSDDWPNIICPKVQLDADKKPN